MSQAIARTARRMSAGVNQPLTRQAESMTARVASSSPKPSRRAPSAENVSIVFFMATKILFHVVIRTFFQKLCYFCKRAYNNMPTTMERNLKDALQHRRSYYELTPESPIDDAKIEEIIHFAIRHIPSAFNSQSTRLVLLLHDSRIFPPHDCTVGIGG